VKTVVVINSDGMGHGDSALGKKILRTFFAKAPAAFRDLEAIVFFNGGVKCLVNGSPFLQVLSVLDDHGVELLACGTCVDHFELREDLGAGEVSSMDDILKEIEAAQKVVTL
jgi:intracellular sulfur oxidation DsrE/DsrF family protein